MGMEQISSLAEENSSEEQFKEKVSEISGIPIDNLVRRDETIFMGDGEEGSVDVIITSFSNLEEDISMMDLEATILSKEEHKKILQDVSYEIVKKIGEYVPQDKIQRLFPGLDLSEIDSYDFSRSKIKLFILSPNDYRTVFSEMYPSEKTEKTGGRVFIPNIVRKGIYVNKEIGVDLSENKLIIINERVPKTKENKQEYQIGISDDIKDVKDILSDHIRRVTAHELIHLLNVADGFPNPLKEGITEWYAQQIVNHWYDKDGVVTNENFPVGYSDITPCISILFNAAMESGIDGSVIDKAFISNDKQSRKQFYDYLFIRYGEESADKIWNWSFERKENPLKYIVDLESKKDSNIGRFLKKYQALEY